MRLMNPDAPYKGKGEDLDEARLRKAYIEHIRKVYNASLLNPEYHYEGYLDSLKRTVDTWPCKKYPHINITMM